MVLTLPAVVDILVKITVLVLGDLGYGLGRAPIPGPFLRRWPSPSVPAPEPSGLVGWTEFEPITSWFADTIHLA